MTWILTDQIIRYYTLHVLSMCDWNQREAMEDAKVAKSAVTKVKQRRVQNSVKHLRRTFLRKRFVRQLDNEIIR